LSRNKELLDKGLLRFALLLSTALDDVEQERLLEPVQVHPASERVEVVDAHHHAHIAHILEREVVLSMLAILAVERGQRPRHELGPLE